MAISFLRTRARVLGVVLLAGAVLGGGWWLGRDAGAPPPSASDLRRVHFATDWKAEAEHGGFYQAQALGFYRAAGLEVTIHPGSPTINIPQLIGAGEVDFALGSNSFMPLNMVAADLPAKAVMAPFQNDPQVLMTHPRPDIQSIADMKGKPIYISDSSIGGFWLWLKARHGFTDAQVRKYNYSLAPFLADENAIQQGYLTSEPYTVETMSGIRPQIFLLSDDGYPGYAGLVLARTELIEQEPQLVAAFVDASIRGWYSYLYGDARPGNRLILRDNPEMRQDILDQAIAKMKRYGIVDSGLARTQGIGAMAPERWKAFFDVMAARGLYAPDLDWRAAFTTQFVNQGRAKYAPEQSPNQNPSQNP